MPRSTRRAGGSGLWALPDDGGERQLRAAARRDSQQFAADDDVAPTEVEDSPPVIDDVDVADPMAAGAADAADDAHSEEEDDDDEEDEDDEDGEDGEEEDSEEQQVQVLHAEIVDGPTARDEDQAEMNAAEQVASDAENAAAVAAAVVMAAAVGEDNDEDDDGPPPAQPAVQPAHVRPHNRAGSGNNHRANINRHPAMQVPVRRRKVLR